MSVARKVISYILAVVISILMISVVLLGSINSKLLNKDNMKKSFKESDYYYNLYAIIKESTENEVMPSGFEETVLDNVFTEEKVKTDVDTLIDCVYDNKKFEVSTEKIEDALEANIQKEIQEKNYVVTEETQENINEFKNAIIDTYKNHISYSEDTVNQISGYLQKIKDLVKIVLIILYVLLAVLLIILFVVYAPATGIVFLVSGLFFIVLNVYSGTAVAVNNILLFNWAFSKTMIYVLNNVLEDLWVKGIILSIIGVGIIIATEYFKAKKFVRMKKASV
ncbi:MAG: hypothetical protein IKD76_01685 [Clostridia bacterium]|nr:hypothetical protein [Clostridia bacterium]